MILRPGCCILAPRGRIVKRGWIVGLTMLCAGGGWAEPGTEAGAQPQGASALEWSFGAELTLAPSLIDEQPRVYDNLHSALRYDYGFAHVVADLSLLNDQKYTPYEVYTLGRYFFINAGGMVLDFGVLEVSGGRLPHRDLVDSPYSLFISSHAQPAILADITFRGGPFTYETRWVRLNTRSSAGYPDRGANYKVFAVQVGDWRFGLQDSAVYVDRVFDEEYFFSPIPNIITQMVSKGSGKPWGEDANDNSLLGLFVERQRPESYLYAQWLVDDINLDFLIPDSLRDEFGNPKIPQKMAWSLGGSYRFPFGRLGFYHAGATKYTFESLDLGNQYGYTYYPDVEYKLGDGTPLALAEEDNYIGYLHGENNLAFLADFARRLGPVDFTASLEYVVSGSKSPANPWHQFDNVGDTGRNTLLLDDPVLEHKITGAVSASWPWRSWRFYSRLRLGAAFNRLALVEAVPFEPKIFRPQPGEHVPIYAWTLGFSYLWKIGAGR